MKQENEIMGYWYFASNPNKSYSGSLFIETKDSNLKLIGCDFDSDESFIVYGTSTNGTMITLLDCRVTTRLKNIPGVPMVEIDALYYLSGGHFSKEQKFNKLKLKFNGLDDWLNIRGFTNNELPSNEIMIDYKSVDPILFYNKGSENFKFQIDATYKHSLTEEGIKQEAFIMIENEEGIDLRKLWDYISMIKGFLMLAYFSEPVIQEVKFIYKQREIDFKILAESEEISTRKYHKRSFLFTYTQIETNFNSIFNNWVEINQSIEPVVGLLLEAFSKRIVAVENKFLTIMHAVESFHRRLRKNQKLTITQHEARIASILDTCPDEYKSWLQDRLNYSNEPTLQDRLKDLFSEIDERIKIAFFPNLDKMIKDAKNSRNYYTHYDNKLEKKVLNLLDLYRLQEKLRLFLLILFLKEIGFTSIETSDIITNGSKYLFNHLIEDDQ